MKIWMASDHEGVDKKSKLVDYLKARYSVIDLGTNSLDPVDYPIYVKKVVRELKKESGDAFGIVICGSGMGVCMVANRYRDIRAAYCQELDDARLSRQHNAANVLCLSSWKTPLENMKQIVELFLTTPFEQGRHQRRIEQFNDLGT